MRSKVSGLWKLHMGLNLMRSCHAFVRLHACNVPNPRPKQCPPSLHHLAVGELCSFQHEGAATPRRRGPCYVGVILSARYVESSFSLTAGVARPVLLSYDSMIHAVLKMWYWERAFLQGPPLVLAELEPASQVRPRRPQHRHSR